MSEFDLQQTDRLLTTTRAVRKRLDLSRPVPATVVLDCLRIAVQAPSGANAQRWRWVVVSDASKKAAIAPLYQKSFAAYMAPKWELIEPDDDASRRMADSASYLADHLAEVPVLVIPCVLDRPPAPGKGEDSAGFWGGILPAVWTFQLALRSRGLGSTWTTLHLNYEREVGEILGIPETVTQVALLPIAYHQGNGFRPAPRRPVEDITYWNSWKSTATPQDG
jgi:nitroreductase